MTLFTQRPSVSELSLRVLDMAKTGVYRKSVFEALRPIATQKQIRLAIAHAKHFGLYSVASLRDAELGTYYQLNGATYQARQHAIHQAVSPQVASEVANANGPEKGVDEAWRILNLTQAIARGSAAVLLLLGMTACITGWRILGLGLVIGAACGIFQVMLQHHLTYNFLKGQIGGDQASSER